MKTEEFREAVEAVKKQGLITPKVEEKPEKEINSKPKKEPKTRFCGWCSRPVTQPKALYCHFKCRERAKDHRRVKRRAEKALSKLKEK